MTAERDVFAAPRAAIERQARGRGINEDFFRLSPGARGVGLAGDVRQLVEDLHGA